MRKAPAAAQGLCASLGAAPQQHIDSSIDRLKTWRILHIATTTFADAALGRDIDVSIRAVQPMLAARHE